MPSEAPTATGIKVVTVAPDNPTHGLPRIQAAYLLFDPETLALRAVLDGTALTTLRTPAVSVAAVLPWLPSRPLRVAVIGAGPQATAHVSTLAAVRPLESATYLVRDPSRTPLAAVGLGSSQADGVLRSADVVVCATSARTPVFDSRLLRDDAVVVAVGSHEPDARELDAALLGRATVVVEDVATALREAGDVVLAIAEGALTSRDLVSMRDVADRRGRRTRRRSAGLQECRDVVAGPRRRRSGPRTQWRLSAGLLMCPRVQGLDADPLEQVGQLVGVAERRRVAAVDLLRLYAQPVTNHLTEPGRGEQPVVTAQDEGCRHGGPCSERERLC